MNALVEIELGGSVARLRLNRPENANTVSIAVASEMRDAIARIAQSDARALIISGNGRAFCAGGDISEMHAAADVSALLRRLAGGFHETLRALRALEVAIIAEVDGAVAGAGLGLALHADLIIATPRSSFLTAYESIDLSPDSGVSYLLPRAIGAARARAMSALGQRISATTAKDWGLVHDVVEESEIAAYIEALALDLTRRPVAHFPHSRALFLGDGLDAALDAELSSICEVADAGTARSQVAKFLS